jgi:hypothetical protein
MLRRMRRVLILAVLTLVLGWTAAQVVPEMLAPDTDRSEPAGPTEMVEAPVAGSPAGVVGAVGRSPREVPPHATAPISRAPSSDAGPETVAPVRRSAGENLRELRRRLADAARLGQEAQAGDAAAQAERDRRRAAEPDPRVRAALAEGVVPDLGRWRPSAPSLPPAVAPAPVGEVKAYWLTPGEHRDGTYESAIRVDEQGRATIETVYEPTEGVRWRVRYNAWAYRDGDGNTVIDARGQEVDVIERPPWGAWSPDSMVVKPDGLVDLIDDKHDPGQGTTGARGPG